MLRIFSSIRKNLIKGNNTVKYVFLTTKGTKNTKQKLMNKIMLTSFPSCSSAQRVVKQEAGIKGPFLDS